MVSVPNKVLDHNPAADRCIDVFVHRDGTFGYDEYRYLRLAIHGERLASVSGSAGARLRAVTPVGSRAGSISACAKRRE